MRKPRAYAEDRSSGEIGDVFTKCGIGRQRSHPPRTLCLFFCASMTCLEHQSVLIETCIFNQCCKTRTGTLIWLKGRLSTKALSYVATFGTKGWHIKMNSAPQEFKDLRKTGTHKTLLTHTACSRLPGSPTQGGHKNCPSHPKVEEGAPTGYWVGNF